ncbi:adhesin [Cellulomonas sp. 179-A 4D5 NHS]|uniref:adhesin n=1 Tax=Cellulomonas sp. 179-A 4D5 NHS TaxID=3142378 RepID=UPI0039A23A5C
MLTLTENARSAVEDLTTQAGLPDTGGLRIAESTERAGSLELALVAAPTPGDDVVTAGGATVYVSAETTDALADQQLDAEGADAAAGFRLAPQQ